MSSVLQILFGHRFCVLTTRENATSVLAYFSLPFRLPGRCFPFRNSTREALLLCEPYFYEYILVFGCGPQVGPFTSRPIMGSIRGEGTPPQTLAVICEKKGVSSISSGCSRKAKEGVQLQSPLSHASVAPPLPP